MSGGPVSSVAAEHAAQTVPGVGRAAVVGVGPAGSQSAVAVVETDPPASAPALASAELSAVSYTHLTLPTIHVECRSRWSPYH